MEFLILYNLTQNNPFCATHINSRLINLHQYENSTEAKRSVSASLILQILMIDELACTANLTLTNTFKCSMRSNYIIAYNN